MRVNWNYRIKKEKMNLYSMDLIDLFQKKFPGILV